MQEMVISTMLLCTQEMEKPLKHRVQELVLFMERSIRTMQYGLIRILEDTPSTVSGIYGSDISEVNATLLQYGQSLGTFKITHYCGGSCCNDEWAGVTATGAPLVEGDTIAVDPTVIP